VNTLLEKLIANSPVITDGAWGTQLQCFGLRTGESPDAWNLTHPDSVEQVAASYITAGSQVILTNTFGANRIALGRRGLVGSVREINREGVRISKQAAGKDRFVFGSMGPCGSISRASDLDDDMIQSAFDEHAALLAENGVDGLVLETMFRLDEALLALRAARKTGLPVVASMTYSGEGAQIGTLISGETLEQATAALVESGADVIGANCGNGVGQVSAICRRLRAVCSLPIWMKPNAGLPDFPISARGAAVYPTGVLAFAFGAVELAASGASFVGGCCGTSPEYIREIRRFVDHDHGA